MNNPFQDFREFKGSRRELPVTRIHLARAETTSKIKENYLRMAEDEARELVWLAEQSRVVKTYVRAYKSLLNLEFFQDDVEDFCASCGSGGTAMFMLSGPAGIYLSALVNYCQDNFVSLDISGFGKPLHFLGYRLREGKKLVLKGNAGDFTGASLEGGHLVIDGSAGNWCGAGMSSGLIEVRKSAGEKTGEWMKGGEIHVTGSIRGKTQNPFGGRIIEMDRLT
jgi:hypothetical protein